MKYYALILFLNSILSASNSQYRITKLRKDGINCYGNTLFQCLYNLDSLHYLSHFKFKSEICSNLSSIFAHLKQQSYPNKLNISTFIKNLKNNGSNTNQQHNETQQKDNIINEVYNLIDFISSSSLIKGAFNDPVEFLELLLHKCSETRNYEDFKFFKKFTYIYNAKILGVITRPELTFEEGLTMHLRSINSSILPKILTYAFSYINGNENRNYKVTKYLKINNQIYVLKSFIVNIGGNNGHFYAVLHKNKKFYRVDDEIIEELDYDKPIKGVYVLFYEKLK